MSEVSTFDLNHQRYPQRANRVNSVLQEGKRCAPGYIEGSTLDVKSTLDNGRDRNIIHGVKLTPCFCIPLRPVGVVSETD